MSQKIFQNWILFLQRILRYVSQFSQALLRSIKFFVKKCFSTPISALLTLLFSTLMIYGLWHLADWFFIKAFFVGSTADQCLTSEGACWIFIKENFQFFLYGMLAVEHRWRANLFLLAILVSIMLLMMKRTQRFGLTFNWFLMPVVGWLLLHFSGDSALDSDVSSAVSSAVDTDSFGGLFLTVSMSYFAIIWSLPLGIVLALGRRSNLPVVRGISVLWIELWRGVPLITVLFMSSVMLPVFLPQGVEISKLSRAMIGVVAFSSAYMAEVVRGGLQGVPAGHAEASYALGLNWLQSMRFIILPQALRIVTPGILNNFVSLFKDTSLVAIIGMFDFLGAVQSATKNSAWVGFSKEAYVFSGAVFWIFCFGISRFASRLAKQNENNGS